MNHKITPKLDRKQFDKQSSRTATFIGCKLLHSQYQHLKVAAANHLLLLQTLGIIIGTGCCNKGPKYLNFFLYMNFPTNQIKLTIFVVIIFTRITFTIIRMVSMNMKYLKYQPFKVMQFHHKKTNLKIVLDEF